MTIEIKELVVRLSVQATETNNQQVSDIDYNDQRLKSIISSLIEEYIEKIDRKEQR